MPPNTVSVCRPGPFGNPFKKGYWFKIGKGGNVFSYLMTGLKEYATADFEFCHGNAEAVEMFKRWMTVDPLTEQKKEKLRGKNLACFCPLDSPCHADVLLKLANE